MLAAWAQASQEGHDRVGRWLGASWGHFQWQNCCVQRQHHLSTFCGWCCQFATGMMACNIWALDALWKKQAWPESSGDEKGHLAFVGEQTFEGLSPCPSALQSPSSLYHAGKKCICFGKCEHPAPTSDLGASGMFEEEGDSRADCSSKGRMVANCPANKSLFQQVPIILGPGGGHNGLSAAIAELALTPVWTPRRKCWFPFSLKLLWIWLPPTPDKHNPCILACAVGTSL